MPYILILRELSLGAGDSRRPAICGASSQIAIGWSCRNACMRSRTTKRFPDLRSRNEFQRSMMTAGLLRSARLTPRGPIPCSNGIKFHNPNPPNQNHFDHFSSSSPCQAQEQAVIAIDGYPARVIAIDGYPARVVTASTPFFQRGRLAGDFRSGAANTAEGCLLVFEGFVFQRYFRGCTCDSFRFEVSFSIF